MQLYNATVQRKTEVHNDKNRNVTELVRNVSIGGQRACLLVCTHMMLIAVTMVTPGVVIPVAVDDVRVEAIFVGNILNSPHVAAWFLQRVLADHLVAVT